MSGLLWCLVCLLGAAQGRVLAPCELVRTLSDLGASQEQIRPWLCIAQEGAGLDTAAQNRNHSDKSADHGIFIINDKAWCKRGGPGNGCEVRCESLRDEDLTDDWQCVQTILQALDPHAKHRVSAPPLPSGAAEQRGGGLEAWPVYGEHCSGGRDVQYVPHCT